MKKLLMLSFALIYCTVFSSCKKDENIAPQERQELATTDIADAVSLYIVGTPNANKAESTNNVLYKVTKQDETKEVVFKDKNGKEIKLEVKFIEKVSDDYVSIWAKVIIEPQNDDDHIVTIGDPYLIRKSDGAIYKVDNSHASAIMRSIQSQNFMFDSQGAMYWIGNKDYGPNAIYKAIISESGDITATSITNDIQVVAFSRMGKNDVIFTGVEFTNGRVTNDQIKDFLCRFPDGTFVKYEGGKIGFIGSFWYCFPINKSAKGEFLTMEAKDWKNYTVNIIATDVTNKTVRVADSKQHTFKSYIGSECTQLPDGGYVLNTEDYSSYTYIKPDGQIEQKTYETGFSYGNRRFVGNYVYGTDGGVIARMNFDTRVVETIFSNNNYDVKNFEVSLDYKTLDVWGFRHSDVRKVLLKVSDSGQILSEKLQSETNSGEIITFIRLN